MTSDALLLLVVFLAIALLCVKPLGLYMADVMEGRPIWIVRVGGWLERFTYRVSAIDPSIEMSWKRYAVALLVFNTFGLLLVYLLQRLQLWLPFNPRHFANVSPDSSFNTAVSFAANTNWQGYSGESTMSYFTQMAGLAVQNFLSSATGIAVAVALFRGLARPSAKTIGNFWVDLTRCTLYILLPLSFVLALILAWQGVVQNLNAYQDVTPIESATVATQTLPMGPMASQESIKELGTNGGGFVNANSAHPFENPNPLTNLLEMLALVVIPLSLTYTFGRMVGDTRQGWAVLAAMGIMLIAVATLNINQEQQGNPLVAALGVDQAASATQPGGNMEGKESRFGIAASALFATITTATSTGAVNAMHDSLTPLGGFVTIFNMQLGEVIPGGVGSGLYSMLVFAIVGVFIAGLMIGRTPEYLGKKIEAFEMKMSAISILVMPFLVLVGTAIAVSVEAGKAGVANPGAHAFSEILYAFTSAANNNGSAFAGLSANTVFYNTALGLAIWFGRYWPIVAVLAIAGSLAAKSRLAPTAGTMPTHGPTFVILLIGTVLLVGVLTFVPALALGPVVEHLMLWHGQLS
jgi:K+-transporting ATPase ATPase A chain